MMKKDIFFLLTALLFFGAVKGISAAYRMTIGNPETDPPSSVDDCKKCIILTDISQHRLIIVDLESEAVIWQWKPQESNIDNKHAKWFVNYSDAKPVYNNKYILLSSSAGGIALVRLSDKKAVFYAYAGGNTHSIELLPDGNIVSASSTGNYLTIFSVDTLDSPDSVYSKNILIESGHNVVWDRKNQLLWSAANDKLKAFKYNFNCKRPDLILEKTYDLIGANAHDLFPIYGENSLWVSTGTNVYRFDIDNRKLSRADDVLIQHNVKSISSGPEGFPVIISKPNESWWTDEVLDARGNSVYYQSGLKMYKARWLLPNLFSYPADDPVKQCD